MGRKKLGKSKNIYERKHPFNAYAFEALYCGLWRTIELIRIRDGTMSFYFLDTGYVSEEKGFLSSLRIKSRKADLSDCICFLRPGVDIFVLSNSKQKEGSAEENIKPVWIDARICSIERKPHESRCSCQFYVKLYSNEDSIEKRTLGKEIEVVDIDKISILQKLERNPCEDEYYRWDSSEDCSSLLNAKLFLGKFSADLSWLLVASALKKVSFDVRSIRNKIVYRILVGENNKILPKYDKHLSAVTFKLDDGIYVSNVVPFSGDDTLEVRAPTCVKRALEPSPVSDNMNLRRSKRRNVQPDRYFGYGIVPEISNSVIRFGGFVDQGKKEEVLESWSGKYVQDIKRMNASSIDSPPENLRVYQRKNKSMVLKSGEATEIEHQNESACIRPSHQVNSLLHDKDHLATEIPGNYSGDESDYANNGHTVRGKNMSEIQHMEVESTYQAKAPKKKIKRVRNHSVCYDRDRTNEQRPVVSKSLYLSRYKEVISAYMRHIESKVDKTEPLITDQWKKVQATCCVDEIAGGYVEEEKVEEEEYCSETEMLWKEMELSLASIRFHEEIERANTELSPESLWKSSKQGQQCCEHEYRVDEEIGVLCQLCGHVTIEIKDVSPTFLPRISWIANKRWMYNEEDSEKNPDDDGGSDTFTMPASPGSDAPLEEGTDNVWALIPDLKQRLHLHQKRAFEFLWRNIAGSLVPAQMESSSENRGGCVISHSPGAGKTFLIISFLVSYLKLFPGKRPLILAPKTALYTWYKEFIKWNAPIRVYQIHGSKTFRLEVCRQKEEEFRRERTYNRDVMHVLDCLQKIHNWHEEPSILLMGYTSFLALTREDSKFEHRRYMCKVLRESPGILILDEGHNPRSTGSRLRKALMKVNTDLRILLSGTLFQNNFNEYFNTLCLARPSFVNEVLMELDPKFRWKKKRLTGRPSHSQETRARKFFRDEIANKINSTEADRIQCLNILRKITNGFIDAYEGGTSDILPGLQSYTLLMKTAPIQQEVLRRLEKASEIFRGYPLELELLITLASIHPSLIKTSACSTKYFSTEELNELWKRKFDFNQGSKVKFVLRLMTWCVARNEKILIFCHNIAPINLFVEIFERVYGWRKGEEILILQGDLELFERGRVMDKFEEPGGSSRVLLASITACAEGISLTAASRVILLDSEWNPSKRKQAIARAFRPGQQKVVYVYQLLAYGTWETNKHSKTSWKEWVSNMIFSEDLVDNTSSLQANMIEDELLREIVAVDGARSFHQIMKNEKASNVLSRGKA